MVRGRDPCWEHCVLLDAIRQKVRCNYCQREFSGGVYRMKFHLAQIKNKDIVPCAEVPTDVRDRIQNMLNSPKKQKHPKKAKAGLVPNDQQSSSSASGPCGSTSRSLLFPRPPPYEKPAFNDTQKHKHDNADAKIAAFFFNNAIPFSVTRSWSYQEMVDAVSESGLGYKPPSFEKLTCDLLEKVKSSINDCYKRYREEWKDIGCTILCDSSSEGISRTKSIVTFSMTCSRGTLFLRSVDITGHNDDAHYLFDLLESIVLEVGIENVVQVITESAASYVYAGRLLMAKYPSLFWSPCASYCINKMLEDISEQEWVSKVLDDAKSITRYIYSHSWIENTIRKFTGGKELIRPRITRCVTKFLSLRSVAIQEENLKHMFSHTEWLSSNYSKRLDAQAVKSLLCMPAFWQSVHEVVSVSEQLVKTLRIVDGDMSCMGYVYEGIERAKIEIKNYYNGIEEKYMPICEMIDRRWNMHHSPLHGAAAFVNPSIFYSSSFKFDIRMRNAFQETMMKMVIDDKDKIEITKEHPIYINAQGALSTTFAIMGRTLNAPGDWWTGYGYEIPTLQRNAIRILSQPCSLHWCRWNWITFDNLHNNKYNKMQQDKFCDLVFVHCNLRLQAITPNRDGKFKPINFDEVEVSYEWPTELESLAPLLDDSWLESIPSVCKDCL